MQKLSFFCLGILVLAFAAIAPTAQAAEFEVTLDMDRDRNTAGGLQLRHPNPSNVMEARVNFQQAVELEATDISISGFDMDDNYLPYVVLVPAGGNYPNGAISPHDRASNSFRIWIRVSPETAKVKLKIAKGIDSADAFNDDTSKELSVDIGLIAEDEGGPRVYSIERVGHDDRLPVTAANFQVIITLSEPPKEFKKDHINVTNATAVDPVALTPVAEDTNRLRDLTQVVRSTETRAPQLRGIYNGMDRLGRDATNSAGDPLEGIHVAINNAMDGTVDGTDPTQDHDNFDGELTMDELDTFDSDFEKAWAKYQGIVGETTSGTRLIPAVDGEEQQLLNPITFSETGLPVEEPEEADVLGQLPIAAPENMVMVTVGTGDTAITVEVDASATPTLPAVPTAETFQFYNAHQAAYTLYMSAMDFRAAYVAAVRAEATADDAAQDAHFAVEFGVLIPTATGNDNMLHPYVVTLTPKYENTNAIVVKVKEFDDQNYPTANKYRPPTTEAGYTEGVDKLTIKVGKEVLKAAPAGFEVILDKEKFIPSDGYLVVADDATGSAIVDPGGAKDAPKDNRTPQGLKYNLHAKSLPNLYTFLASGGVIDVVSPMDLTITEIMWGTDASLVDDNSKSQWIELHNSGTGANTGENDAATKLIFYGYGQAPSLNADGTLPTGVKDRVGTIDKTNIVWAIVGRGQSGRTGVDEEAGQLVAVAPKQALKSMYRLPSPAGADGTMAASWMQYNGPPRNFDITKVGIRHGTPGADHIITAADQAAINAAAKSQSDAAAAAAEGSHLD